MAQKRMFSKHITESDAFLDMPLSAQVLYFHLNMNGDDDGFVSSPKKIMRIVGAKEDDLRILVMKRFIIFFESGVCVIKHWLIHNTLKNDRYKPTVYSEEKKLLQTKENKAYTDSGNILETQHNITEHNETEQKPDFEEIWSKYPNKDGKKAAKRHFEASVKTQEDFERIKKALKNYLSSKNVRNGYVKNGSTWFNNWEDWVDYKGEVKVPSNNNHPVYEPPPPVSEEDREKVSAMISETVRSMK